MFDFEPIKKRLNNNHIKVFKKKQKSDIIDENFKPRITFFTGSGISAESGIQTFRGNGGRWNNYNVSEICSKNALKNNIEKVLGFYNERRFEILSAKPNDAHYYIKNLEDLFDVSVVTQNVDDLHERAGSKNVIHLHGEIMKSQSKANHKITHRCLTDINIGDKCPITNSQLRPHIVLFGEHINNYYEARRILRESHIIVVIGTSLQVQPAAGLVLNPLYSKKMFIIDPNIDEVESYNDFSIINDTAVSGLNSIDDLLKILSKYVFKL